MVDECTKLHTNTLHGICASARGRCTRFARPSSSSLPLSLPPRPQLHCREGLGTRLVGGGSCRDCCAGGAGGGGGGGGGGTALLTGSMCILHGGGGGCGGEGLPTVKRELIKYTKSREFKLACSEL